MRNCTYTDPNRPLERCTECGKPVDSLCNCPDPNSQANRRLWAPEGLVIRNAWNEIDRAQDRAESNIHLLSRLVASVGEVNAKLLAHDEASREQGTIEPPSSAEEIYRSLVRTVALAVRLATEGDPDYFYEPPEVR